MAAEFQRLIRIDETDCLRIEILFVLDNQLLSAFIFAPGLNGMQARLTKFTCMPACNSAARMILLAVLFCFAYFQSDGQLNGFPDLSFNTTGRLTFGQVGSQTNLPKVLTQPDQKLLVGGICKGGSSNYFALVRLLPSGAVDSAFGHNGTAMIDSANLSGWGASGFNMALQPDGKVLMISIHGMARVDSLGRLDTGFAIRGRRILWSGYTMNRVPLALNPDGSFLISYGKGYAPNGSLLVCKFKSDGQADSTFGAQGSKVIFFQKNVFAGAIAVQNDGKILCTGGLEGQAITAPYEMATTRLFANGELDSAFGINGTVVSPGSINGRSDLGAYAIALQPDGKFVIGGELLYNYKRNMSVLRYKADGTPDSSFNANGVLRYSYGSGMENITDLALQPDGHVVACGYVAQGNQNRIAVLRASSTGLHDLAFGGTGLVLDSFSHSRSTSGDQALSLTLQAGGKTVVVSQTAQIGLNTDIPFQLSRYDSTGLPDSSFGKSGKVIISVGSVGDEHARKVIVLPNNQLLVGGQYDGDATIMRLNKDGSLDSSFAADGMIRKNQLENPAVSQDSVCYFAAMDRHVNGSIYLAYFRFNSFWVERYFANGMRDLSYGNAGSFEIPFRLVSQILVLDDGKLLVLGRRDQALDSLEVMRVNSNGTLDVGFGQSGISHINFYHLGCDRTFPGNLIVLRNGKIMVSAEMLYKDWSYFYLGLVRLKADGKTDFGFGQAGTLKLQPLYPGRYYEDPYYMPHVKETSQGKLVLTARTSTYEGFIARYNSSGTIDSSFANNGLAILPLKLVRPSGTIASTPPDLIIQPDDKILLGYYAVDAWDFPFDNDSARFALLRYDTSGSLDAGFGSNGMTITRFAGRGSMIASIALTYDGKIVAAGWARGLYENKDWAVARYHSGLPDMDPPGLGQLEIVQATRYKGNEATFSPNPAKHYGTLSYFLPAASMVKISMTDVLGRKIFEMVQEEQGSGRISRLIDLSAAHSPGIYLLTVETATYRETLKIVRE